MATAFSAGSIVSRIELHPAPLLVIVILGAWYRIAVSRSAAKGKTWPPVRSASWAFGLLILAAATLSGLASYTSSDYEVEAVSQVGIFMLAPVFLAMAAPITLLIDSSSETRGRSIQKLIAGKPGRVIFHPVLTWAIFAVALYTLYFSGQYHYAAEHPWFMQVTHLELLVVGCMWSWPLIGADPRPRPLAIGWRMVYVLTATVFYSTLGPAIESQKSRIAPGITVSNLHTGAGTLWTAGELFTILLTIGVLLQWASMDEGRAHKADGNNSQEDAIQLARWRAERRAAGLADARASDSLIVASRPARSSHSSGHSSGGPAPADVGSQGMGSPLERQLRSKRENERN